MSNLRAIAKREIAKEKGRRTGRVKRTPTALERAAEKWVLEQELKTRERQKEEQAKKFEQIPFRTVSEADVNEGIKGRAGDEIDWHQYKPGAAEGLQEQKPVSLNSATIRSIAKKLIAREWRKARGKPRRNPRFEHLEQAARTWNERKELERRIEKEQQQKLMRYTIVLNDLLDGFALRLKEEADWVDPNEIAEKFEELLEELGEIYKVEWSANKCQIWFEPWTEIRTRRINEVTDPVIYTAFIDADMNIASLMKNEDETFLTGLKEEELDQAFKILLEDGSPDGEEIDEIIEDAVAELGRIVSFNRTHTGWVGSVEPWEQMRLRKILKKGQEFVSLTQIFIEQTDGNFNFRIHSD